MKTVGALRRSGSLRFMLALLLAGQSCTAVRADHYEFRPGSRQAVLVPDNPGYGAVQGGMQPSVGGMRSSGGMQSSVGGMRPSIGGMRPSVGGMRPSGTTVYSQQTAAQSSFRQATTGSARRDFTDY